ncbi:MAG: AmmeMemoRadiSam system radical SAM enzyme, partial [Candidatus Cloacimonetes bacterium]|nr:AmmeMemoRadiSam system radical SAM enzyme [Candidatus Cloacimonadota bacterium]
MPVLKREAMYYQKLGSKTLRCELCPHFCEILDSEKGLCNSRQNESGLLYATNYGQTVALALDPIEKKPLYHYRPGSKILSLGLNSCNLSCKFCQNYQISQY